MASYEEIYLYNYNDPTASINLLYNELILPMTETGGIFDHTDIDTSQTTGSGDPTGFINIYDSDNNRLFRFGNDGAGRKDSASGVANFNGGKPARYFVYIYNNLGSSIDYFCPSNTNTSATGQVCGYHLMYGYRCRNGIIFNVRGYVSNKGAQYYQFLLRYPSGWFIFTKNQNNMPVCIVMGIHTTDGDTFKTDELEQAYIKSSTYSVETTGCWTDASPLRTFGKVFPTTRNQSVLVPFFTNSQVGEISYTPFAGRFISGNNSSFIYDFRMHLIEFNDKQYLTNGVWAIEV